MSLNTALCALHLRKVPCLARFAALVGHPRLGTLAGVLLNRGGIVVPQLQRAQWAIFPVVSDVGGGAVD